MIDGSSTPVKTKNLKKPISSYRTIQFDCCEKTSPCEDITQSDELCSNFFSTAEEIISFPDEHKNDCIKTDEAFSPAKNTSFVSCESNKDDCTSKFHLIIVMLECEEKMC